MPSLKFGPLQRVLDGPFYGASPEISPTLPRWPDRRHGTGRSTPKGERQREHAKRSAPTEHHPQKTTGGTTPKGRRARKSAGGRSPKGRNRERHAGRTTPKGTHKTKRAGPPREKSGARSMQAGKACDRPAFCTLPLYHKSRPAVPKRKPLAGTLPTEGFFFAVELQLFYSVLTGAPLHCQRRQRRARCIAAPLLCSYGRSGS